MENASSKKHGSCLFESGHSGYAIIIRLCIGLALPFGTTLNASAYPFGSDPHVGQSGKADASGGAMGIQAAKERGGRGKGIHRSSTTSGGDMAKRQRRTQTAATTGGQGAGGRRSNGQSGLSI